MINTSRRIFLKIATMVAISLSPLFRMASATGYGKIGNSLENSQPRLLGIGEDGYSHVYHAINGSPEDNLTKTIEMMGGIDSLIGQQDIVVIKPNAQWWNQGMSNTNTLKAFIESVLGIPCVSGEIILAENHHFPEDNSRGWTTEERNGLFNYNELIDYFQKMVSLTLLNITGMMVDLQFQVCTEVLKVPE